MIRRIVSGGQTGADRAALDTARELGIEVLNVAGPRESEDPDIHAAVRAVLDAAFHGTA